MNKRELIITIVALTLATVVLFLPLFVKDDLREETTVTTEIHTSTEKVSEIATESVTEIKQIEVVTAPKAVRDLKKKQQEATTEEKTEESTGHIDVNGYGWVQLQYSAQYHIMDGHLTRSNGSIRVFGHRETWYSTNESAGQATAVSIPGKHVADDGTIRDKDGYICVASSDLPFYSIVMTSVGPGKVYDCGCSHGTIDVYTTW